jgi:OOP family OmpA-OmpF porin
MLFAPSRSSALRAGMLLSCLALLPWAASAADVVDVSQQSVDAKVIKDGLFPDDDCRELEAAGYKCMGFKPAVRFLVPAAAPAAATPAAAGATPAARPAAKPASSFELGSAELPEALVRFLDMFVQVLRDKRGTGQVVRIEGHADATGTDDVNVPLSQKRAEAVKEYLVKNGADQSMLTAVGMGSKAPRVPANPKAAENRRVEFARQDLP